MGWQDAPEIAASKPKWSDAPEIGESKPAYMSAPELPPEQTQMPQDGRSVPSLRQGSSSDMHALATDRQFGPPKPEKPSRLGVMSPQYLPDAIRAPLEAYSKAVVDPLKSRLYGDTLPPDMQHPLVSASPEERQSYQSTETLKSLGADPAMMAPLGLGAARLGMRLTRPTGQPPVPIEAPVVHAAPPAPRPAQPDIQDLARQSPSQQHERFSGGGNSLGMQPGLPARGVELGQLPTGSLERSLEQPQVTAAPEPALRTLPTGSMLRVQRPDEATASVPLGEHYPQAPAERGLSPAESTSFESRRLHGNQGEIGPPAPPLKSAEDMLAERHARFQADRDAESRAGLELPPEPVDTLSLMLQPEQAGPRGPISATVPGERTLTQNSPSAFRRIFQHAFDVLDSMGPYTRQIGDILRHSFDYSEAGTKQNFLDYLGLVQREFGDRTLSKKAQLIREGDWSAVLNRSVRDFGLTKKEVAALVELHEVGKDLLATPAWQQRSAGVAVTNSDLVAAVQQHVSPKAWETLRAELLDPRVQTLFREGWQIMTGRASSLPSVQDKALVHDPVTGRSRPVGPPSPVWPHQAITDQSKRILSEANLKAIYNDKGYKAQGIDYETFVRNLKAHMEDNDPTSRLRRYAGLENVRHLDILKDAKAHNRTVAESLEYYGYETDPLRALLRHNSYALKRAVFLEHEEALTNLRQQVRVEYGGEGAPEHQWVEQVIQRTQGLSKREDILDKSSKAWEIAQAIMYPAFLKASWSQNFLLQPNYVQMMTGTRPIAQAIWRRYGKMLGMTEQDILQASERSAANFPSFLAKYHMPDGPIAQYNKTANELNFFSQSDWTTRTWAGEVFIPHAENLIRKWYQDPANPKWQKALQEGNLNPKDLMAKMTAAPKNTWDASGMPPIPQEALMRYAQTGANRAMGRMGIQSLPKWLAGDDQSTRLFMMLHRQIASNEGVFYRNILQAPTAGVGLARALRAVFGAELAGSVYQGLTNWIVGNDFFDVNEPFVKSFHGNKEAAFAAKALLIGMGTFTSGLVLSGLNLHAGNYGGMTYGILSPPAATFIDEIAQKAAQGKLLDVAARLNPSQTVDVLLKRQRKEEKQRKQAGGTTLGTGIGMGR